MNIHFIDCYDYSIAFFPDTKRFFKVNSDGLEFIKSAENGASKEYLMNHFELSQSEYDSLIMQLSNKNDTEKHVQQKQNCNNKNVLGRLVIHLTNDCNLRCKYCYANGGNYRSDRGILSKETLDKIIEVFFSHFDEIGFIQFFGGEPLMNIPMMEYACKKVSKINEQRDVKTKFGVIINGTLINNHFINLVKEYQMQVTISYDGNPKVNDMLRVNRDGLGTSSLILENAKKLKAETNQPNTIEVTYTQYHVDNGISIYDVLRHINSELPNTYIHLIPAGASNDNDYKLNNLDGFTDSVHEIFTKAFSGDKISLSYSLVDRIYSALLNRDSDSPLICDAGLGTLSVAINGDVYPCFMFTDNQELKYGNISHQDLFTSDTYNKLQLKIRKFSIKSNNKICSNCFIKKICNGCLGLNSFYSGNQFKLSDDICDMFRNMTDAAIVELTKNNDNNNSEQKELEVCLKD